MVFAICSSADAQTHVVSYKGSDTISAFPVVGMVPDEGLVLTDVAVSAGSIQLRIVQVNQDGSNPIVKLDANFRSDRPFSFNSGIPFDPGTRIEAWDAGTPVSVVLSGYIPTMGQKSAPAVSSWGLSTMVLLIVAVATILLRRPAIDRAQS